MRGNNGDIYTETWNGLAWSGWTDRCIRQRYSRQHLFDLLGRHCVELMEQLRRAIARNPPTPKRRSSAALRRWRRGIESRRWLAKSLSSSNAICSRTMDDRATINTALLSATKTSLHNSLSSSTSCCAVRRCTTFSSEKRLIEIDP